MMRTVRSACGLLLCGGLLGLATGVSARQPAKPVEKLEPVAVVGCLRESTPNVWMLAGASDPVASHANAPSAKELSELPKGGTRTFHLIGGAIFKLESFRGQSVAVKGLRIPARPADRLNVTSVTTVAPGCPGPPGFN